MRWQRAAFVRIFERGDELSILDDKGTLRRFSGEPAALARRVLEFVRVPRTDKEIASLGKLAPDVLEVLVDANAVVPAAKPTARPVADFNVLLALTGGFAAAYAPALAEMLLGRGFHVRICATPSALRFVSALSLEALTHDPVVRSRWPKRHATVPHLELARWADVVVVYPATATTLFRIAHGDCSTVVSAVAISTRAPVILVPAMNEAMFDAPSVRRNITQLRDDGFIVTHPSLGYEVAEEPSKRTPAFGGAPPVQTVAIITEVVLRERVSGKSSSRRSSTRATRK